MVPAFAVIAEAEAALTATEVLPVIDAVTVSVAVTVGLPAVFSVIPLVKTRTPLSPAVNV